MKSSLSVPVDIVDGSFQGLEIVHVIQNLLVVMVGIDVVDGPLKSFDLVNKWTQILVVVLTIDFINRPLIINERNSCTKFAIIYQLFIVKFVTRPIARLSHL